MFRLEMQEIESQWGSQITQVYLEKMDVKTVCACVMNEC